MSNKLSNAATIFVIGILVSGLWGCGRIKDSKKNDPVGEIRYVPTPVPGSTVVLEVPQIVFTDKSIGIDSLPIRVEKLDANIQELSQAVALVEHQTGKGSGFFISADGWFLTNEHVLEKKMCYVDGCPSTRIILGFQMRNKPRIFTKFKVVAHGSMNDDLDFTLLKVQLPADETVPHLNLEEDPQNIYKVLSDSTSSWVALGHPSGATLRASKAKYTGITRGEENLSFAGVVMPGNSGGPLIDLQSKKVVGLVKQVIEGPKRSGKTSTFLYKSNEATSIPKLLQELKKDLKGKIFADEKIETLTFDKFAVRKEPRKLSPAILENLYNTEVPEEFETYAKESFLLSIGQIWESSLVEHLLGNEVTPEIFIKRSEFIFQFEDLVGRRLKRTLSADEKERKFIANLTLEQQENLRSLNHSKSLEVLEKCLGDYLISSKGILDPKTKFWMLYKCRGHKNEVVKESPVDLIYEWFDTQAWFDNQSFNDFYAMIFMYRPISELTPSEIEKIEKINERYEEKEEFLLFYLNVDSELTGLKWGLKKSGGLRNAFPENNNTIP